ncbi:hypothetical protein K6L09_45420, partial [Burkholderia cepacia]
TLKLTGQFKWYTMSDITTFDRARLNVTWSATDTGSGWAFAASHPTSLANMTWLLPKKGFALPIITQGFGSVVITDSTYWLVTANSGSSLEFTSAKVH